MINEVQFQDKENLFNRSMEPSDWRFSATIVGLIRYFDFHNLPYKKDGRTLYYNIEDVDYTKKDIAALYRNFVEERFYSWIHYAVLKDLLIQGNHNDTTIKLINKKLDGNTIMKKVFKDIKDPIEEKEEILKIIEENQELLNTETFKNAKMGYKKFINPSKYHKTTQKCCRLWGFYVDTNRKMKSLGFNFNKASAPTTDCIEFDYLPFGFTLGNQSIFINSNFSIEHLLTANNEIDRYINEIAETKDSWYTSFYQMQESSILFTKNVEIILKEVDREYYNSVMLRESSINIFSLLKEMNQAETTSALDKLLKSSIKITDNDYLSLNEAITSAILNQSLLDDLLEKILKLKNNKGDNASYYFQLSQLIKVNSIIYYSHNMLEENMDKEELKRYLTKVRSTALDIKHYFIKNKLENKLNGYRQKLTSALIAKDYERFIEIMLELSSYTKVPMPFLHELIKDFKGNKCLAYEFINDLSVITTARKGEEE